MDRNDALDSVTEIEVSASELKQLQQYENAEAQVTLRAEVGENESVDELEAELSEYVEEQAKLNVLRRWESYIRKNAGTDDE